MVDKFDNGKWKVESGLKKVEGFFMQASVWNEKMLFTSHASSCSYDLAWVHAIKLSRELNRKGGGIKLPARKGKSGRD